MSAIYGRASRQAAAAFETKIFIEGTRELRAALKDMDRKLDRRFATELSGAVRKMLPTYRAYAPASGGRRHYPGGARAAARSKPWGSRTIPVSGGSLRKSLKVVSSVKGVRVVTGTRAQRGDLYWASIVHAVRKKTRAGNIIAGNPYLWRARKATKTRVELEVQRVLTKYIDIVDRRADGRGP